MAESLDITEKTERNLVRVAYGFKFLKNGLASFIDKQIHQQHKQLINCLETDRSNRAKRCASCSSKNLLPNHHTRQCIQKHRSKCFCSSSTNRRKCPNGFCSRFYDNIVFAHAEKNPSWQNTNPSRWYSDHWQLAKCFLGTTGYLTTRSASETDVTGLLSIAINDLYVVHMIDNLDNFKQARQMRNEIFHRKMFAVRDEEVAMYIDRMIRVLQDKPHLLHDKDSRLAVDQLKKLKQNEIYISTEDADDFWKTDSNSEITALKEDLITYYREHESMITAAPLVDEHKVPVEDFYVIPPMWVYIRPLGLGKNPLTEDGASGKNTPQVKQETTASQLFLSGEVRYKKIYITANAGFGKTSFSQKLFMTWCQAHSPPKSMTEFYEEAEIAEMKCFEFLFLLHLRDYQTQSMCNLDDLIMQMLSNNLSRNTLYTKYFLQKFLHAKQCLILLDGLDELAHSDKCNITPAVPHNNHPDSCTVLTTFRPWKLGTIGLSEHNIDRHIEISELDERARDKLEKNAVRILNERNLNLVGKNIADFNKEIR